MGVLTSPQRGDISPQITALGFALAGVEDRIRRFVGLQDRVLAVPGPRGSGYLRYRLTVRSEHPT
ncbi:hypothetical protein AXW38_14800 [Yersinia ruckeri]|nr:hypothetical protein AXW26_14755 [Yersinia ruckeri]OJC07706.1 hypothetical protein AXW54_14855 [Yersinia ruckeri]OJC11180.1 hypothetical protein AXW55_14880 [Yersinia ruckeri]OJC15336.1 hypothetical protein AXW53_14830 [Yersinia ruckeri]OJC29275.1 hypothetical protein AXW28_14730 [Yersinia ruckeri]